MTTQETSATKATKDLVSAVSDAYSRVAQSDSTSAKDAAIAVGYTEEELSSLPERSYLGVGCGNPVRNANLKKGENVLDLGSGGGVDVFLAAKEVGPTGSVVGLDVSPEMVALARTNAKQQGLTAPHVAFVESSLTDPLPIAANKIDCVISNCVVNLVPEEGKAALFKELYRVLKPGGRVCIDDIIALKPFSEAERNDLSSYVSCVSSAMPLEDYQELLKTAGFDEVTLTATGNDLSKPCGGVTSCSIPSQSSCCGAKTPLNVNSLVASYRIVAKKSEATPVSEPVAENVLLNWQDAYPKVKSQPPPILVEELEAMMRSTPHPEDAEKKFAVIDVRRNDHAGGHVRGSDNWHAQTFHDNLPAFLEKYRDTPQVMFYCQSSNGRGPRCAGWYQDYLDETGTTTSKAYVLKGGVKAWLAKYDGDETLVDRDRMDNLDTLWIT